MGSACTTRHHNLDTREELSFPHVLGMKKAIGEDCAIDERLEGRMELEVVLPDGRRARTWAERKTPALDLLVQLAAAFRLGSPAELTLQWPLADRTHKPSTPIGALDSTLVHVVPKSTEKSSSQTHVSPAVQPPFEPTFRLQILLPRGQRMVLRAGLRESLSAIRSRICEERGLEASRFSLVSPSRPSQPLNLGQTLADYGATDLSLVATSCLQTDLYSTTDLIPYSGMDNKRKKGGLPSATVPWKKANSESSSGPESRAESPARDEQGRLKKRPAPPPPARAEHARNGSDSSGFHEAPASVISDSPASSGLSSLDGTTVSPAGHKKRKAPPPPPLSSPSPDSPQEKTEQTITEKNSIGMENGRSSTPVPEDSSNSEDSFDKERDNSSPECVLRRRTSLSSLATLDDIEHSFKQAIAAGEKALDADVQPHVPEKTCKDEEKVFLGDSVEEWRYTIPDPPSPFRTRGEADVQSTNKQECAFLSDSEGEAEDNLKSISKENGPINNKVNGISITVNGTKDQSKIFSVKIGNKSENIDDVKRLNNKRETGKVDSNEKLKLKSQSPNHALPDKINVINGEKESKTSISIKNFYNCHQNKRHSYAERSLYDCSREAQAQNHKHCNQEKAPNSPTKLQNSSKDPSPRHLETEKLKGVRIESFLERKASRRNDDNKLYGLEGSVRGIKGQVRMRCADIVAPLTRSNSMQSLNAPLNAPPPSKKPVVIKARANNEPLKRTKSEQSLNELDPKFTLVEAKNTAFAIEQQRLQNEYLKLQQQFFIWQNQLYQNQDLLQKEKIMPPIPSLPRVVGYSTQSEESFLPSSQNITATRKTRPKSIALVEPWQEKELIINKKNLVSLEEKDPWVSPHQPRKEINIFGTKEIDPSQNQGKYKPVSKVSINIDFKEIPLKKSEEVLDFDAVRQSRSQKQLRHHQPRSSSCTRQRRPPEYHSDPDVLEHLRQELHEVTQRFARAKVKENSRTSLRDLIRNDQEHSETRIKTLTYFGGQILPPNSIYNCNNKESLKVERNKNIRQKKDERKSDHITRTKDLAACQNMPIIPTLDALSSTKYFKQICRTQQQASSPPKTDLDPREELMIQIRNFGGTKSLKRISSPDPSWQHCEEVY